MVVKKVTENPQFSKDWTVKTQIKSSSGSIMDCIVEGFGRSRNNEFCYSLGVAKGSCDETQSQTYRALGCAYFWRMTLNNYFPTTNRTSAAIQGLIDYLNRTSIKGARNHVKTPFKSENFPMTQVPQTKYLQICNGLA